MTAALFIGLLITPAFAEGTSPEGAPRRTVAVIHCDYPPVSFMNKTNAPSGFFVDIMDIVAKRAGLRVNYICENGWPEMLNAVEGGKGDLSVLMKSAEREKRLLFTVPIEMTYLSFFARSRSNIDEDRLPEGSTVGAIKGSMSFEQLRSRPGIVLVPEDSYQHGIMSLLAGRIDLFAGEEFAILCW